MNSMHIELLASSEQHYRTQVQYPAVERHAAYHRILAQPQPAPPTKPTSRRWFAHLGQWVLQRRPA
jgi:hypothetical protein